MAATPGPLRLLLKQIGTFDLTIPAHHPLRLALTTLWDELLLTDRSLRKTPQASGRIGGTMSPIGQLLLLPAP